MTTPALAAKDSVPANLYDIPVKTLGGEAATLKPYQGKVLLIVNTASECGYTPQYKGLQALHEKYSAKGFTVLGFPSNDFGAQEPGSAADTKKTCDFYKVKFPVFTKNPVGGKDRQPVYSYLIENAPSKGAVAWNFEKFLVGKDGKVLARFPSKVAPDSSEISAKIEEALK